MGILFVGYRGIPALSPACTTRACKGNAEGLLEVHYYFPSWFTAKAVSIALAVNQARGPEFCLRVTNVRPNEEPIFQHCFHGGLDAVRSILIAGEASVLDVNAENGNSLLHIAMLKSQLDVVELLIQFGAEPHAENCTREYDVSDD